MVAADDRGLDDVARWVSVLREFPEVFQSELFRMGVERLADSAPHRSVLVPEFPAHPFRQIQGLARREYISPGGDYFLRGLGTFFIKGGVTRVTLRNAV